MEIIDFVTYIHCPEDKIYLRSKLLPVNMRLFHSSNNYRLIIGMICNYIKWLTLTKPEDYKLPHGMSGANIAIPFNIIGIAINRGKEDTYCKIMINPIITNYSLQKEKTKSNCGSIRLEQSIEVERSSNIRVTYYTEDGVLVSNEYYGRNQCSFTIQHEVDHNNGIMITDY